MCTIQIALLQAMMKSLILLSRSVGMEDCNTQENPEIIKKTNKMINEIEWFHSKANREVIIF
jgi:hypothetical protein